MATGAAFVSVVLGTVSRMASIFYNIRDFSTLGLLYISSICICSFLMFVYVRAKALVICPGYDVVVHFVPSVLAKS